MKTPRLAARVLVLLALIAASVTTGCATEDGSYGVASNGGVVWVPRYKPHAAELDRCEATGMTREQCCTSHDIDPCE